MIPRFRRWRICRGYKRDLERRGFKVRMPDAECPECGAHQDNWCFAQCKAVDLADYR